ncbi:hypothetical protein A2Z22_02090 [Candidatus Woesebacteria bacterium RBG_16_34_12]|uniref:Uncharacterized protein n=1 Tax=Candidatus Woesebacteria bacterium RBG_16_34_12 TaxID=1802480 RepID=A0A1F7X961_9BACT|nr:MAG: hypothetical protein A2Z22_02090 [Candidatus Woesebacteria bacterium RBG_16_34_12]
MPNIERNFIRNKQGVPIAVQVRRIVSGVEEEVTTVLDQDGRSLFRVTKRPAPGGGTFVTSEHPSTGYTTEYYGS